MTKKKKKNLVSQSQLRIFHLTDELHIFLLNIGKIKLIYLCGLLL